MNRTRILKAVLGAVFMTAVSALPVQAGSSTTIWVDGKPHVMSAEIRDGHTMVLAGDLAAGLGMDLEADARTVSFNTNGRSAVTYVYSDGEWHIRGMSPQRITLPINPEKGEKGYVVPLRATAEAMEASVWWLPLSRSVIVDRRGFTYFETTEPLKALPEGTRLMHSTGAAGGTVYVYEKARPGGGQLTFLDGAVLHVDDQEKLGVLFLAEGKVMARYSALIEAMGACYLDDRENAAAGLRVGDKTYIFPTDGDYSRSRGGYTFNLGTPPIPHQGDWLLPLEEVADALGYTYWSFADHDRFVLESRGYTYQESSASGFYNPREGIDFLYCRWTPTWASRGEAPDPSNPGAGDPIDQRCIYRLRPGVTIPPVFRHHMPDDGIGS